MARKTDPPSEPVSDALAEIASQAGNVGELKSDRVVAAFERQILSGHLASGARLPTEDELCQILGVSRSVVRDSIRTLVARGLVVVRQGSGTVIAEPGTRAFTNSLLILLARSGLTMGDVMQTRATIEKAVVPLAATSGTEEEWTTLEAALDAFEQAVDAGDDQAATLAHTQFHIGLLDAAHQPALSLMLKPMTEITTITSSASIRRNSPEDWEVATHRPILRALRSRNSEAAVRAIVAHYAQYDVSKPATPYLEFLGRRFSDAYFGAAGGNARRRVGRDQARRELRAVLPVLRHASADQRDGDGRQGRAP